MLKLYTKLGKLRKLLIGCSVVISVCAIVVFLSLTATNTLKATFTRRNMQLRRVCRRYSKSADLTSFNPDRYFYLNKPKLSMCLIPKVASTSLTMLIKQLANNTAQDNHQLRSDTGLEEHLMNSYKAVVVRHPFERLLSAYLFIFGKELDPVLSSDIRQVFGRQNHDAIVTFPEFVTTLINSTKNPDSNNELNWAINNNVHWLPYWKLCGFCHPDAIPDLILKLDENFNQQVDYFLQSSGLSKLMNASRIPFMNPTDKDLKRTENYFNQLTKSQVQDLWSIFKIDFEMFDYSIEPYLSYAL